MSHAPDQSALDRLLEGATCARIAEVTGGRELLVVEDPNEILELSGLLAIIPSADKFHCLCPGDQVLKFSTVRRGDVSITLHHGRSIRLDGWDSDAMLADGEALLRWLDGHGAPAPLHSWEADRDRAERDRLARESWERAAPPALVSLLSELPTLINPAVPPPEPLLRATESLREAYTDEQDTILVLLDWFGSGAGPWSGYPSYEGVAEALLLRIPTDAIVEALGGGALLPTRAEGAARLFASWWFGRMRPGEAARLPDDLVARLRAHVEASGHPDKIARFSHAIGR